MSPDVVQVETAGGYVVTLTFEGGEKREVNIRDLVPLEGVFEPLKDLAYFRQVSVNAEIGTIVWPNGADICPDVLYAESRPLVGSRAG
ncbi:MAG: DUF2442 domain-containing protein [Planctomycetes bacterium]|nr:DUF2442 domain-containing protein [Planctomycetota bacterium]